MPDKPSSGKTATPKEGSLQAPTRHPLDWKSEAFYDKGAIDQELERVFDICHGCRRCFNLCESFPILFDMIDESETGELDSVDKGDYKKVVDACTLCDMCFMTKCPYVPPHEFNLDFPHLMLRHRAAEFKQQGVGFSLSQLAQTDRNGKIAKPLAGLANWGSSENNQLTRPVLEKLTGIDRAAPLPKYHHDTFTDESKKACSKVNKQAPAFGRKAVLYATCFVDYNKPETGLAAQEVLAHNGVETQVVYPACCGMPHLEHGNLAQVAAQCETVTAELLPWVEKGYDIIALTASCGLMLKFEWPLLLPDDAQVKKLAAATHDISEYIVGIAKNEGIAPGLAPLEGGVSVHLACHARAQNMGAKSAEMLRLIPETKVDIVERCSGHGGTFGIMKQTRGFALKVAKPAARQLQKKGNKHLCSDCPLACKHLAEAMVAAGAEETPADHHPIEILAKSYGL